MAARDDQSFGSNDFEVPAADGDAPEHVAGTSREIPVVVYNQAS